MKKWQQWILGYADLSIMIFILLVLFLMPVLFTRVRGEISWHHIVKIWKDLLLLLPIFILNHWLLAPRLMLRKKYLLYFASILLLIGVCSFSYYYYDDVLNTKPSSSVREGSNHPKPIPPYAHLLMYSLLITGVDTGILFSKKWQENEDKKHVLEKENAEMQLNILKNQISPHFFMNTLNNIYALVDLDTRKAKEAVMKLSKLMRYMLYENESGRVKLSKEFEFISSYIDLMKLRFDESVKVDLILPDEFDDFTIPPMLFISYIENAFKYGVSYQQDSHIHIIFEIDGDRLLFHCQNFNHADINKFAEGGLGIKNNENRLKLLYGNRHSLNIHATNKVFSVLLSIPIT